MNKYKVTVYAICKNEEKFVSRWVKSMSEADEICVLDTGSTDNTVTLLKELGVKVKTKIIDPWRFDKARNESMNLISKDTDICVCTDLDEVFVKGWRKELEHVWNNTINRVKYNYNWSLDELGKPIINFYQEKIHSYGMYKWTHPVHEILTFIGKNENTITTDEITLNHYPDNNKSRGSYLKLLELSVKEEPENDRNMHYLGREYMYYGKWNKCIDTLIKHLNLKSSVWKDERCASMRFIGRSYVNLKRYLEAEMWYKKAMDEAPYLREPYIELALLYNKLNEWKKVITVVKKALKIKINPKTYINEQFSFNETPYDLLSVAYCNIGDYEKALYYIKKALKINNSDNRLKINKKIITDLIVNKNVK